MIRLAVWRFSALLSLLTLSAALPGQSNTAVENLRRFDLVWQQTRDKFYDPKMHGVNWDEVGRKYRPRAEAAASRSALQQTINEMLGELHASHLHYSTSDEFDYYLLKALFRPAGSLEAVPHIGVQGIQDGNAFVVKAILDGSPAAQEGIRFGDRLLTVNDKPFTTSGAFRSVKDDPAKITLERGGSRLTIYAVPVRQGAVEAYAKAIRSSVRILERDGKRLGYVHLWCMSNREFVSAFDEALRGKLANTDGLILDLRDGYGGSPEFFDYLLFRPDIAMTTIPRGGQASSDHSGYSKPLVVLINGGSRSAKEYFAYELKKSGRGTLVGTKTMGAFLGAGGFPIADDGMLLAPIIDLRVDGKRLEGVGVSPDVDVDADNAYSADDKQVARGIEVLLEKVHQQVASPKAPSTKVTVTP